MIDSTGKHIVFLVFERHWAGGGEKDRSLCLWVCERLDDAEHLVQLTGNDLKGIPMRYWESREIRP